LLGYVGGGAPVSLDPLDVSCHSLKRTALQFAVICTLAVSPAGAQQPEDTTRGLIRWMSRQFVA